MEKATTASFKNFGLSQTGIEPVTSRSQGSLKFFYDSIENMLRKRKQEDHDGPIPLT